MSTTSQIKSTDAVPEYYVPQDYQIGCLDDCFLYQPVKWLATGFLSFGKAAEHLEEDQWEKAVFDITKVALAGLALVATLFIAGFILTTLTFPLVVILFAQMMLLSAVAVEIIRQIAQEAYQVGVSRGREAGEFDYRLKLIKLETNMLQISKERRKFFIAAPD